ATGAGRPAEITKLVALAIVTQALEGAARASPACGAPLELDLPAANEINRLPSRFVQVRIRDDRLRERRASPALGQTQRTLISEVDVADRRLSPLEWSNRVSGLGFTVRRNRDRELGRRGAQPAGQRVEHARADGRA